MAATNGFFGNLQGPFTANEELFTKIQADCNKIINYISKIGIYYTGNFDLAIKESQELPKNQINIEIKQPQYIKVIINNIEFQIGKTRILELEDVKITSIKFKQNVNDNFYIDYQYE